MRVMCVVPIATSSPLSLNKPKPQVGDIDLVTEEIEAFGYVYYALERFDDDSLFRSDCFAPLPDAKPETVTEEETILQTA
jgi:hypothetical protein